MKFFGLVCEFWANRCLDCNNRLGLTVGCYTCEDWFYGWLKRVKCVGVEK